MNTLFSNRCGQTLAQYNFITLFKLMISNHNIFHFKIFVKMFVTNVGSNFADNYVMQDTRNHNESIYNYVDYQIGWYEGLGHHGKGSSVSQI